MRLPETAARRASDESSRSGSAACASPTSTRTLRVLETSHPPTYYVPVETSTGRPRPVDGATWCEFKGEAAYFDLVGAATPPPRAAWTYPAPESRGFEALVGHVAVHAERGSTAAPSTARSSCPRPAASTAAGATSWVVGPFKGEPGTWGW